MTYVWTQLWSTFQHIYEIMCCLIREEIFKNYKIFSNAYRVSGYDGCVFLWIGCGVEWRDHWCSKWWYVSCTVIITNDPSANVHWYISHIDGQEVQDDDELERELEALLAPQKGRAPCTTKEPSTGGGYGFTSSCTVSIYNPVHLSIHHFRWCRRGAQQTTYRLEFRHRYVFPWCTSNKVKFTEVRVALQRH